MGLLLGALIGLILGGASAVALCVLAAWAFDIQQTEGAYAMAVAFVWTGPRSAPSPAPWPGRSCGASRSVSQPAPVARAAKASRL